MSIMKKLVLMFTICVAFATVSIAQTTEAQPAPATEMKKDKVRGGGKGKGNAAGKMAKTLDLTADQKLKMKDVQNTVKGKLQAIKTDKTLTKEQKMAQMKEVNNGLETEIKGILTAEQYTKWTAEKAQRKEQLKERRKENKGGKAEGDNK
jgi:periplasmic protein CpxP/Spy